MLARSSIIPVVHVEDLERARRFYGGVLGLLEATAQDGENLTFATTKGDRLELMLDPEGVQHDATVVTFEVDDVEREMKDLLSRGARFEDVEVPGAQKAGKLCVLGRERAVWLKDSEGNWLCVHDLRGAVA